MFHFTFAMGTKLITILKINSSKVIKSVGPRRPSNSALRVQSAIRLDRVAIVIYRALVASTYSSLYSFSML